MKGSRMAYFPSAGEYIDCPVYDRYKLQPGAQLKGPAIIEEKESTAIVGPTDQGYIDGWLNLIITLG